MRLSQAAISGTAMPVCAVAVSSPCPRRSTSGSRHEPMASDQRHSRQLSGGTAWALLAQLERD